MYVTHHDFHKVDKCHCLRQPALDDQSRVPQVQVRAGCFSRRLHLPSRTGVPPVLACPGRTVQGGTNGAASAGEAIPWWQGDCFAIPKDIGTMKNGS
jgi:hypothetical protein